MLDSIKKVYTVDEIKGLPFIGMLIPAIKDPLQFVMNLSQHYGDIISFNIMRQKTVLVNHPDLIHHILVTNHKNYKKNKYYVRFESAIGLGLLTSNGEKWKQDRQKIQPLFNRSWIADYHFEIMNNVSEKYKKKWLDLTESSQKAEMDITKEMAKITTEIILKTIFGKHIDDKTVLSLHHSYEVLIEYLKDIRVIYNVDLRKLFLCPSYFRFKQALDNVNKQIKSLYEQYKEGKASDSYNMLALLIEAQKEHPDSFSEKDIRDHCTTMVFAGFESTSILMQWLWYVLDDNQDIANKLTEEIKREAPCAAVRDSSGLTLESLQKMDYLSAVLKETMRLYPPFWMTGREAVEDDYLGDFKVKRGTDIAIVQMAMHRHTKWWDNPESFIPERFLGENEKNIIDGLYIPFSQGPRKCSGHVFAEMEAKIIATKLLPFFRVKVINRQNNPLYPSVSLKLKNSLRGEVSRLSA